MRTQGYAKIAFCVVLVADCEQLCGPGRAVAGVRGPLLWRSSRALV